MEGNSGQGAFSRSEFLVYILEHLYTKPSLSYSALKAGDGLRGQCLAELCEKLGFEFFLVSLEREVEGTCAYEDNEGV